MPFIHFTQKQCDAKTQKVSKSPHGFHSTETTSVKNNRNTFRNNWKLKQKVVRKVFSKDLDSHFTLLLLCQNKFHFLFETKLFSAHIIFLKTCYTSLSDFNFHKLQYKNCERSHIFPYVKPQTRFHPSKNKKKHNLFSLAFESSWSLNQSTYYVHNRQLKFTSN